MNKNINYSVFIVLSVYYMHSNNPAECQTRILDSFSTGHRTAGNIDCETVNSGMVTDGKICNQIGFQHYEKGDVSSAIDCYKKAIALSPEYPVPFNNLGVVYLKSSKLELARECFSNAIVLNPEYVKAICNLAIVSYKMGDLETAKQLYQKAKCVDSSYVKQRIEDYINHNR